ncbi:MAG: tRNA lysidine(34) synthetase TilS [Christensenella sp.]|nr:tRNA lysidine(34) synthetase TilS [Christensenella sp.]
MEKSVRDFIKENNLACEGQTIGVAVSGGADSMALLVCLCAIAPSLFCSVVCVHFEHGIRGEQSRRDADFVADFCAQRNIPFYMSAADVPLLAKEWGMSEETAAKRAREEYFNALLDAGEADVIATAHHLDDHAESVLMHILRGSGMDGLIGIHAKWGRYIRPLLCVDKKRILAYLEEKGVSYVTDCTNAENEHTRNFVRNVLMPQIREKINPDAVGALSRLSEVAACDAEYLCGIAEKEFPACAACRNGRVEFSLPAFLKQPEAIRRRLVRLACAKLHIKQDIERIHVSDVIKLAQRKKTGTRTSLSRHLYAQVEYEKLLIGFAGREKDRSFCQPFDFTADNVLPDGSRITCIEAAACDYANADPFCAYLDADRLPRFLTLRTRQTGDVIHPLGAPGTKKLKDYFIDKKLPREQRDAAPLLADGSRVLWVIGFCIDDSCRVSPQTKKVLCLKYSKNREEGQ